MTLNSDPLASTFLLEIEVCAIVSAIKLILKIKLINIIIIECVHKICLCTCVKLALSFHLYLLSGHRTQVTQSWPNDPLPTESFCRVVKLILLTRTDN